MTPEINIFISRKLSHDSIFHEKLSSLAKITDISLIDFKPIKFNITKHYNTLFFYSKNGIKYFFDKHIGLLNNRIGVMGKGSADYMTKEYSVKPDFIASRNPKDTIDNFLEFLDNQSVLFIGAKNSMDSIRKALPKDITSDFIAVYDNEPKKKFSIPSSKILVFTSPMNAKVYMQKYQISNEYIICIGDSTHKQLSEFKTNIYVAEDHSEEALAECCLKIIKNEISKS